MNQLSSNYKRNKTKELYPLELLSYNQQKVATKPITDLSLMDSKIPHLMKISKLSLNASDKIKVAEAGVFQNLQQVEIFNSEGLHATDDGHYCRLNANVIAEDGDEKSTGFGLACFKDGR